MGLNYIELAPGFAREVLDVYEVWEGKEGMPMKVKELMLVLKIEVARLYKMNVSPKDSEKPKIKIFRDTRLG